MVELKMTTSKTTIIYQENAEATDLNGETMTAIAILGGAFNWLYDPAEDDIYTDADGEPV